MLIKPLFMSAFEAAINRYLALGNNVNAVLAPLAGKVIAIEITPHHEIFYIHVSQDGIQLLDQYPQAADTTLRGSAFAFCKMGLSKTPMRALFQGEVSIEGDMEVGHHFQRLFSKLDFNFEPHLAKLTGDKFAQQASQLFDSARLWSADTLESLKLNTSELLQEETRDLPAPAEVEILSQKIDELRHDYDRLHARILRIQALLAAPKTPPSP